MKDGGVVARMITALRGQRTSVVSTAPACRHRRRRCTSLSVPVAAPILQHGPRFRRDWPGRRPRAQYGGHSVRVRQRSHCQVHPTHRGAPSSAGEGASSRVSNHEVCALRDAATRLPRMRSDRLVPRTGAPLLPITDVKCRTSMIAPLFASFRLSSGICHEIRCRNIDQ